MVSILVRCYCDYLIMIKIHKRTNISKTVEISIALLLFLLGGFIYIAFRSTSLRMFRWFEEIGLHNFIMLVRNSLYDIQIPMIIKYCIPDGLWTLSYILLMDAIWSPNIKRQVLFCGIIPIVGGISEILQYFSVVKGTFDVVDLFCYLVPYVLYLIFLVKL
jgi:hypothetical protein